MNLWKPNKQTTFSPQDFAEAVALALTEKDSETTSGQDDSLLARIEKLERRIEVIHEDCLKYLQKGAKTLERANKLREQHDDGIDEEEMGLPNQIQLPMENEQVPVAESDFDYVERAIREGGQTPL